mmetsp:Transcript_30646/g.67716  ORF Transcript_30646/g.67716 Transcript_30646/m.67716 type:complete len:192 (+) Transcript_30646:129-704(+)|eukprot:CAMPEP_0173175770 /NCGR_PEP_ID=MMETSP1141-20130122/4092_1 /TAXON_ID=483371 /ORGANISM="non described non described, Strain CCMP2298" /LENGTH=191 /DNA_ID=CAMNT_0014098041 /DNA_START=138 /DNA_END=713 /DNA_ORIENTATION=-
MGPKAAPKEVPKEAPKNQAKVAYVHIHASPAPAPEAPVTEVETTPTPAASVPEPVSFELAVNLLCRADIVIDFVRRQLIKAMQEKLAGGEKEKDQEKKEKSEKIPDKSQKDKDKNPDAPKLADDKKAKLRELVALLTAQSSVDLLLRDAEGKDVTFHENPSLSATLLLTSLGHYTVGVRNKEDTTVTILAM